MEPEGIRIKLNLSEFFNDKRKYSYIFIEQNKIKDFYDLDSHIRDEFPIRGNIIFLIDNVFIPHSESIKLLHDEETLTLSADTIGLNYLQTKCCQKSETKNARKRKRKKHVCPSGDEREESCTYFQPEDDIVLVTEKKKKKIQLKKCNVSQNMPYSFSDTSAIMQDTEKNDSHGSEKEMFVKENEVYGFSKYEHEEPHTLSKKKGKKVKKRPIILEEKIINDECESNSIKGYSQINSNTADKKNIFQFSNHINQGQEMNRKLSGVINENNIKRGKQKKETEPHEVNYVCPTERVVEEMSLDDTKVYENELILKLNSEAHLNDNHEGGKLEKFSENHECINNRETSTYDTSCNLTMGILLIDEEPISTDAINIENSSSGRKQKRIRTRRRKKKEKLPAPESQPTSGPVAEQNLLSCSIPEAKHIRFSDEISGICISDIPSERITGKGNLNEINDALEPRSVCINSGDNDLNETVYSTHLRADVSPISIKPAVCLSRTMTPTPVDTFNKLLSLRKNSSTPFVFNRAPHNSNNFQEVISENKREEQPVVIDCENDNYIIVEKYPLINSSPKKGDILAFKLYRMASDYTPHITDYIIAVVLQYCVDTLQVTVKVQRGRDELKEPQGRFSLCEENEESCDQNDTYEFNWNELIETRLLYP